MEYNRIYNIDCLEGMRALPKNSIDAIVTDPPYALVGNSRGGSLSIGDKTTPYGRSGPSKNGVSIKKGFMGKEWDGQLPGIEVWQEALRVCKPGAHMLAFGGTRTHHRLMVAIEDAGWEIRDCLMWVYGSGFPKSHDVSKTIDKAAGVEREDKFEGSIERFAGPTGNKRCDKCGKWLVSGSPCKCPRPQDEPQSDAAKQWSGWGTALKPAYEIIILAQKPHPKEQSINIANLYDTEAKLWSLLPANVAEKNFGLNLVEFKEAFDSVQWSVEEKSSIQEDLFDQMDTSQFVSVMTMCLNTVILWRNTLCEFSNGVKTSTISTGIDPTIDLKILNSCLSVLMPHTIIRDAIQTHGQWQHASPAVKYLNAVSMKLNATRTLSAPDLVTLQDLIKHPEGTVVSKYPAWEPIILCRKPLEGTVAQNVQKWGTGAINIDGCRVEHNDPEWHTKRNPRSEDITFSNKSCGFNSKNTTLARANQKGRFPANFIHDGSDEILGGFPETTSGTGAIKRTSSKDKNGNTGFAYGKESHPDGTPMICYGGTGSASRFFYCAKAPKSERNLGLPEGTTNKHPTVKPLSLIEYLIKLISVENAIVLDPFMGSGTTGIACIRLGRKFIGYELEKDSYDTANMRIMKAQEQGKISGWFCVTGGEELRKGEP